MTKKYRPLLAALLILALCAGLMACASNNGSNDNGGSAAAPAAPSEPGGAVAPATPSQPGGAVAPATPSEPGGTAAPATPSQPVDPEPAYQTFLSYKDVGDYINAKTAVSRGGAKLLDGGLAVAAEPAAAVNSGGAEGGSADMGLGGAYSDSSDGVAFSGTNVQVQGVDEGDIVKTDGQYIYLLRDFELSIIRADGADTRPVSNTFVIDQYALESENTWYQSDDGSSSSSHYRSANCTDMYLYGDILAVLCANYESFNSYDEVNGSIWEDSQWITAKIYNVSNPESPRLVKELGQDGYLTDSRLSDGVLYLLTTYNVYDDVEGDPEIWLPKLYTNGDATPIAAQRIIAPGYITNTENHLVVSGIDLTSASMTDTLDLIGCGGSSTVYMSVGNILVADADWGEDVVGTYTEEIYTVTEYSAGASTNLTLLTYENGQLDCTATGEIKGTLLNQFSLDEHEEHFRIVTTVYENSYRIYADEKRGFSNYEQISDSQTNSLVVLDGSLNTVGSITGLAQDERVYSVRFDGDIGYFVTFRQTDPLFAVDLSDPASPKVLSALKIPGFSQYLHVYGDGLLFGLGLSANEETGRTGALKLSMFDTSDPLNVTELESHLVDGVFYSEALYEHHAVFISPEKNLIGFPSDDNSYLFYSFEDGRFLDRTTVFLGNESWNARALFIGDFVYIATRQEIIVLSIEDMNILFRTQLPRG